MSTTLSSEAGNPPSPYESRRERLRERLAERGVDVAWIVAPANIYYLTGFLSLPHERLLALAIFRDEEPVLVCPALDQEEARTTADLGSFVFYRDHEDPLQGLAEVRRVEGCRQVGIEKETLTVGWWERLSTFLGRPGVADLTPLLKDLRLLKSADEIAKIRAAIQLTEQSLEAVLERAQPGVREVELAAELEYRMRRGGASRMAFNPIVLGGRRSALPHGTPGNDPLREGDPVLFDWGAVVDGYCADISRTFVMGKPSGPVRELYETVSGAQEAALEAVKAGDPIGRIDRAARERIASAGYGDFFIHRVGHGMGIEPHEAPSMHQDNPDPQQNGMVLTIEPGVYLPEVGGVRIEDDIVVRDDGAEVLTTFPKGLRLLG